MADNSPERPKFDGHRLSEFIYGTVTGMVAVTGIDAGHGASWLGAVAIVLVGSAHLGGARLLHAARPQHRRGATRRRGRPRDVAPRLLAGSHRRCRSRGSVAASGHGSVAARDRAPCFRHPWCGRLGTPWRACRYRDPGNVGAAYLAGRAVGWPRGRGCYSRSACASLISNKIAGASLRGVRVAVDRRRNRSVELRP